MTNVSYPIEVECFELSSQVENDSILTIYNNYFAGLSFIDSRKVNSDCLKLMNQFLVTRRREKVMDFCRAV